MTRVDAYICIFLLNQLALVSIAKAQSSSDAVQGLALQVGVGLQQRSVKVTGLGINNTTHKLPDEGYDSTSGQTFLGLSYTAKLNEFATLGVIAELNPIKNHAAVSLVPGYTLANKLHGYLKLGWAYSATSVDQGPGRSKTPGYLNGVLVGVGVKVPWNEQLFGYAEVNYVNFASMRINSWQRGLPVNGYTNVNTANLMLGVGYKF